MIIDFHTHTFPDRIAGRTLEALSQKSRTTPVTDGTVSGLARCMKAAGIDRAINLHEVCDVNPFGIIATQEAYTEGGAEWLRQLNEYIWDNYQLLLHTFREQLPQFPVVKLEGTYLAWVDCEVLGRSSVEIAQVLCSQYGVWVNDGEMYGAMQRPFVRVNLACPRAILAEGLQRMVAGMKDLCREKE